MPVGLFKSKRIARLALNITPTLVRAMPAAWVLVGSTVYRVTSPIKDSAVLSPNGKSTLAGGCLDWMMD